LRKSNWRKVEIFEALVLVEQQPYNPTYHPEGPPASASGLSLFVAAPAISQISKKKRLVVLLLLEKTTSRFFALSKQRNHAQPRPEAHRSQPT
jgi:hypothetical protein